MAANSKKKKKSNTFVLKLMKHRTMNSQMNNDNYYYKTSLQLLHFINGLMRALLLNCYKKNFFLFLIQFLY